jgi:hypothetical protein
MNIYQRLAKVMGEVDYIQKEKKQGMRYSIVSHDAVTAKVRPILLKHGIVYHISDLWYEQIGNRTQVKLVVTFVNIDAPEECIESHSIGFGIDDQDKGAGKAISYAVKYALLKTLGLETGDDPDENQEVVFDNPLITEIKSAIEFAATAADLSKVAEAIKQNATQIDKGTLASLRAMFAKKQTEINNQ